MTSNDVLRPLEPFEADHRSGGHFHFARLYAAVSEGINLRFSDHRLLKNQQFVQHIRR
jgi:hypothetical protein